MALVSTTYCFSLGQALNTAVTGAIGGASGVAIDSLTIQWDSALNVRGPGFRAMWRNSSTHVFSWWDGVLVGPVPPPWPLLWPLGAAAASFQANGNIGASAPNALDWAIAARDALVDCIELSCIAGTLISVATSYTIPGKTAPWFAIGYAAFAGGEAAAQWQIVVTSNNSAAISGPTVLQNSLMFGASSQVASTFVVPAVQSSSDVPFDLDVAVNNGANIFSVMSRTFTEPGIDDGS